MRTYVTVRGGRVSEVAAEVVREQPLTIYVNGEKFLTLLCSPMMLEALADGMKQLFQAATEYQRSRGIHGAALSDGTRLLVVAEDVGRHNAVDKVKGQALLEGIPTTDRILLSTGRVSSEMLLKAARMGVPVVASRTSPTEMAVALAEQLNVTVCGYVRPDGLNLYAGEALVLDAEPATRD